MKITTLLENTTVNKKLKSAHGLSLYIETDTHKILFDTGPNGLFADNAQKLGIDPAAVDTLVISHGHADHGGGLKRFLEINSKAQIYVRPTAFEHHSIKVLFLQISVSLDTKLLDSGRFIFTDPIHRIDDELTLFSDVHGTKYQSASRTKLYKRTLAGLQQDDFAHEHSLLVTSGGKTALFAGCSHRGIVNILERAEELTNNHVDTVIAGFHLYNPATGKMESAALVDGAASALGQRKTKYYTCHCTGQKAFNLMQHKMGEQMQYIATGEEVQI
jgi:7,8-dihydropterin-6-yl-methyl-4-(beta-D-ribofuranosyl)aminobenzene 5'-phosphate synthase